MIRYEGHGSNRVEDTSSGGEDQLSMIPTWSVVLAIIVFGAVQYLFHGVLPHHKHELLPMRLLMGYSWGTAFASYVLLVGYVSRDGRRRRLPVGLCCRVESGRCFTSCCGSRCCCRVRIAVRRLRRGFTSVRSASSSWLLCA